MRIRFARILDTLGPQHLEKASIELYHELPVDQRTLPAYLIRSGLSYDPVSNSLRRLCRFLAGIHVAGVVNSALLWPASGESAAAPAWPSLRKLPLALNRTTLSGSVYFAGNLPPGRGPEDDAQ